MLQLSFSAKRWPSGLSFKTKELTKPKPVPATGCENNPVSSGGHGTGPTAVSTACEPAATGGHGPATERLAGVNRPPRAGTAPGDRRLHARAPMSTTSARRGLALAGALGVVALGVHLEGGHGARADTNAGQGATPQPVLGTADRARC